MTTAQQQSEQLAGFRVAWDRPEQDPCDRGTPGCCVADHDDHESCETW